MMAGATRGAMSDYDREQAGLPPAQQRGLHKRGEGRALKTPSRQALQAALIAAVTLDDIKRIAITLKQQAFAGDLGAIRELLDRLIGKAQQAIELSGADSSPLVPVINLTIAKKSDA